MRAVVAVLAAVPVLVLAQAGGPNAAPDESLDLNGAASRLEGEVGPLPGSGVDAAPPAAAGETHTVQRGDTLWDLSTRYLQDPWQWPKIWSWNPEIANPHWIYPGNVLRLGTAGPGAAAAPAQAAADAEVPPDDSDLYMPPKELDDFSRADLAKPQDHGEGDEVRVTGPNRIGWVAPRGVLTQHDGFVTRGELALSGVLDASFEDKLLLTIHDRAYARFAGDVRVQPGQTYVVYRTGEQIRHPDTKQLFGYKTTVVGLAKVTAVDDRAATLQVVQAYAPIERGAYLAPWSAKMVREVARRPNERSVSGTIVASQVEVVGELAEHHVVFVDRGTADGVADGNVFTVTRSGDPYGRELAERTSDASLPVEDIGALLVLDAKENASTALVVKSTKELLVGDRVELRVAPPVTAGSGSN